MRQRDRAERNAGNPDDVGLNGDVVAVVVLDRGGGLHLDHFPGQRIGCVVGQHDIREGERAAAGEAGLENRLPLPEQLCAAGKRRSEAFAIDVDQRPFAFRVEHATGNLPDLVADLETALGLFRVRAQVGAMHLQPQALFALAQGHQLRFGEISHEWITPEIGQRLSLAPGQRRRQCPA